MSQAIPERGASETCTFPMLVLGFWNITLTIPNFPRLELFKVLNFETEDCETGALTGFLVELEEPPRNERVHFEPGADITEAGIVTFTINVAGQHFHFNGTANAAGNEISAGTITSGDHDGTWHATAQ